MDPLTKLLHTRPFGFLYLLYRLLLVATKVPFWTALYFAGINKPRPSWSLKKALLSSIIRDLIGMCCVRGLSKHYLTTFWYIDAPSKIGRTRGRNYTKEVVAKDCLDAHFIWVDAVPPNLIVGDIKRLAQACGAESVRIPAYGFGRWDSTRDLARDGEKVILNLHGGAYIVSTTLAMSEIW
jgi:hypothetical protein